MTKGVPFNEVDGKYFLLDGTEVDWYKIPCPACGKQSVECTHCTQWKGDHDPCIGHVENIKGVCCGHGDVDKAYISFTDERGAFYGEEALPYIQQAIAEAKH